MQSSIKFLRTEGEKHIFTVDIIYSLVEDGDTEIRIVLLKIVLPPPSPENA
jgi:hypothetical protein